MLQFFPILFYLLAHSRGDGGESIYESERVYSVTFIVMTRFCLLSLAFFFVISSVCLYCLVILARFHYMFLSMPFFASAIPVDDPVRRPYRIHS